MGISSIHEFDPTVDRKDWMGAGDVGEGHRGNEGGQCLLRREVVGILYKSSEMRDK